jgi:hypothetical protein
VAADQAAAQQPVPQPGTARRFTPVAKRSATMPCCIAHSGGHRAMNPEPNNGDPGNFWVTTARRTPAAPEAPPVRAAPPAPVEALPALAAVHRAQAAVPPVPAVARVATASPKANYRRGKPISQTANR